MGEQLALGRARLLKRLLLAGALLVLALLCLGAAAGKASAAQASITSFAPYSACVGSAVWISGAFYFDVTAVKFNGVSADFNVCGVTLISAFVPAGATNGKITVTVAGGFTATSSSSFTLLATPTLTSFSPSSGPAGTTVTFQGADFAWVESVEFNGVAAFCTFDSPTQISAEVPNSAVTGGVSVRVNGLTLYTTTAFTVVPTLKGVSPSSGAVGDTVQISGTGLAGVKSVQFNDAYATYSIDSPSLIVAAVPAAATRGRIGITTDDTTTWTTDDFVVTPGLTSITPDYGTAGTTVTFAGTNFSGATSVTFGGVSAAFTVDSPTQIRATVPVDAPPGPVAAAVTTPSGTGTSHFTFRVVATLTAFSPASGAPGTTVTLTGTNLAGATSVKFGGVSAAYAVDSATQITATVPAGATSGLISVTVAGRTLQGSGYFSVMPTPAPTLTSFSPTSGVVRTAVTLTGTTFTGATAVTFNGTSAVYTVDTPTQITATVPVGATSGKITVTTAAGTATSASDFGVLPAPPTLTSFSPTSAFVGAWVTLTGTTFTGATAVTFNGASANYTVYSPTQILAVVPASATSGRITVTTAAGTATSASDFAVAPTPPTLTAASPASGVVGTEVTLTGTTFTGATAVTFNGTSADYTVDSPTKITATVPAAASSGLISVVTAAGVAKTAFSVLPTFTSFSPASGVVGTTVTIVGTGFAGVSAVSIGASTTYTIDSPTQITATVPTDANSGPVRIRAGEFVATSTSDFSFLPILTSFSPTSGDVGTTVTLTGTGLNDVSVVRFNGTSAPCTWSSPQELIATVPQGAASGRITVTTTGGSATSASDFTVFPTPTISWFSPNSGAVGATVTLNGTGLTGAKAVAFNGTSADYTVDSPAQITATVPAGATSGRISVTGGGMTQWSASTFTVVPAPTLASFSPTSGSVGTAVTLTGTALTGATAVTFNGTSADYTVDSSTQITATVPAGATSGRISVTGGGLTQWSASTFTVAPTLTSFTAGGAVGATVTLTGGGLWGATAVTFNGTSAVFTVDSPTQITATVPVGATSGRITVTTAAGTAWSASDFTVFPAPTLTSFSPTSGAVGTAVTLTGTNLTGAYLVSFHGSPSAVCSVDSATQITTTVPSSATSGAITVTTPNGTASSSGVFTFVTPTPTPTATPTPTPTKPSLTKLSPTSGKRGITVTITGRNFGKKAKTSYVKFGAVKVGKYVSWSATRIKCKVPAKAKFGNVKVTLTTAAGTSVGKKFTVKR